jgi:putative PIN family toxin of toxin-antitoxin system
MLWRVVLDTSVLVAALRSRRGASFALLELLRAGAFEVAISVPLVVEYEAVLMRHVETLGLHPTEVGTLVDYLCVVGKPHRIHFLWRPTLRDAKDDFLLELAVAAECDYIVAHNVTDFAGIDRFGVRPMKPGQFLRQLEEEAP